MEIDLEMKELLGLLKTEKTEELSVERWEKQKRILNLLAAGSLLAFSFVAPGVGKLGKYIKFNPENDDWRMFNTNYLTRTLKNLERQKLVKLSYEKEGKGKVELTEEGKRRVLEFDIWEMKIVKPVEWDHKWRLVFYDVSKTKNWTRDRFRRILKTLNFYPFQKSVYLHAYPCEREIEFLRYYLGVGEEVRIVLVDKMENDEPFRKYFGV